MSMEKLAPQFIKRAVAIGLAATAFSALVSSPAEAQVQSNGYPISIDYDQDGIINTVDTEIFIAAPSDVDGDGIINALDRTPYTADLSDVDFDGIKNSDDFQPYTNNGFSVVLKKTAELNCDVATDADCDGINDIQDRFYRIADIADADFDGIYNELDPFPYVPYVRTDTAALLNQDPNYCDPQLDNDCDGITNIFDRNDNIADFPDVDGDGVSNSDDPFPFRNFNVASGYLDVIEEPYARFHFPVILNPVNNTYNWAQNLTAFTSQDFDGDRLADAHDPYITLYDSDNNGRSDSLDATNDFRNRVEDVDYYLEGLEQKRIEEGVLTNRVAQQQREEQWLAELQEEKRYDQAIYERQQENIAINRRIADRRIEEGVLADRSAQQRREEQWRLEEQELQRLDDLRRGQDRFDVLHEDNSYITEAAEQQVLNERLQQQSIIENQQDAQLAAQRQANTRISQQQLDDKYEQQRLLAKQQLEDDYNSQDYDDNWYEWKSFENEPGDYYNDPNYSWYEDF